MSEISGWHGRLFLARLLTLPFPHAVGNRLRAGALRLAGFQVGTGTILLGMPTMTGPRGIHERLVIGRRCNVAVDCYFDLADRIEVEEGVTLGPQMMILTGTHEFGPPVYRAGSLRTEAVRIGQGAWLGARCTVLPGVTIGRGAIVAAGAVVAADVPEDCLVGGVPARVIRQLGD